MTYPRIPNIALGRNGEYARQVGAGVGDTAIVAVLIELTGVEAEAVNVDYDTLSALLAGTNTEQTTMGRKVLTAAEGVAVTVDDSGDVSSWTCDPIVWATASGNDTALLVWCFNPDTTGGTDADLVPIQIEEFISDPAGANITYTPAAGGVWSSTDANA